MTTSSSSGRKSLCTPNILVIQKHDSSAQSILTSAICPTTAVESHPECTWPPARPCHNRPKRQIEYQHEIGDCQGRLAPGKELLGYTGARAREIKSSRNLGPISTRKSTQFRQWTSGAERHTLLRVPAREVCCERTLIALVLTKEQNPPR